MTPPVSSTALGQPKLRLPTLAIDAEVLRRRIDRVRHGMVARQLDAVVLYSNPSSHGPGTTTAGNVRYLTNATDPWHPALMVLPLEADPVLLCQPDSLLAEAAGVGDIRIGPPSNYDRLALQILEERCATGRRIGVVGRVEMRPSLNESMTDATRGWEFEDADDVIARVRIVKEAEEIERHRIAGWLCDNMVEAAAETAKRPDTSGWQLLVEMEYAARTRGAEFARSWIAAGPNPRRPSHYHSENMSRLEAGDQIFVGTYVIFDGYWGHSIRPGFKGPPTKEFSRVVEILHEVQESAFSKLRPGLPLRGINKAMVETINRHFPGTAWGRSGHGLGLDYSDPLVSDYFDNSDAAGFAGDDLLLEPGMVLEIHPGFRAPELGCNAPKIGDMCLITEDGFERLTSFSREPFEA